MESIVDEVGGIDVADSAVVLAFVDGLVVVFADFETSIEGATAVVVGGTVVFSTTNVGRTGSSEPVSGFTIAFVVTFFVVFSLSPVETPPIGPVTTFLIVVKLGMTGVLVVVNKKRRKKHYQM